MSMRTIARSSSKRKSASDLASSVLPTPVGPRNRNEPVGRLGSEMPARLRRTASETAVTAARWPTSRCPMISSIRSSLAVSPSSSRPVGMPVQASTTSAISSGPTSSLTIRSSAGLLGRLGRLDLLLQLGDPAVEDLRGGAEVTGALEPLGLDPQLVDLLAQLTGALERGLLPLPARLEPAQLLLPVGEVGAQPLEPVLRGVVGLALERELLHLHPVDGAAELVDLDRRALDLHAQPGGGLVDQVDRLVGQLTAGDVAVGEHRRGHQGGVGDLHAVVRLVLLLQPAQDRHGVLDARLADEDLLEAALEGRVLLDPLAVLVERGRTDQVQLAAREHRLEHVAGVHRGVAAGARADDRVQLVDEGDDLALGAP